MSDVNNILAQRGSRYGDFERQAEISQGLKQQMEMSPNWENLAADQKEALHMMQHKIARILNGDPEYLDSWADIAGYAQLVYNRRAYGADVAPSTDFSNSASQVYADNQRAA